MLAKRLKEYLDNNHVKYIAITHSLAYTAQEVASSAHVPGKELAKTVIVKIDGDLAMAVVPASYNVVFSQLQDLLGTENVELAAETEFMDRFPECEVGAMPPFGNLYDMDVYVASPLAEDKEIAFNAGSHRDLIKLSYQDYERLVKPKVASFSAKLSF